MFPKFSVFYFTKGRKKALFKDKRGVGGREKREKERLRESEQKERR